MFMHALTSYNIRLSDCMNYSPSDINCTISSADHDPRDDIISVTVMSYVHITSDTYDQENNTIVALQHCTCMQGG